MIYFLTQNNGQNRDKMFKYFQPLGVVAWLCAFNWRDKQDPTEIEPPFQYRFRKWCEENATSSVLIDLGTHRTEMSSASFHLAYFENQHDIVLFKLQWSDGSRTQSHQTLWWSHCDPRFAQNMTDKEWHPF